MGGRSASGSRAASPDINTQVDQFLTELEDRTYGSSKKMIPEKQQKEYRALKREILMHIETWGNEDGNLVVFNSGFATDDNYLHTTAKLNQYQRMVKSEVKSIKTDLKLGVITKEEAEKELFVARSIDETIKRRRQMLKEF